jgi:hypothetical protein
MAALKKPDLPALVISSILVCYGVWGTSVVTDLFLCETRFPGTCTDQRREVHSAATAIPVALMAWLSESPLPRRRRDPNAPPVAASRKITPP